MELLVGTTLRDQPKRDGIEYLLAKHVAAARRAVRPMSSGFPVPVCTGSISAVGKTETSQLSPCTSGLQSAGMLAALLAPPSIHQQCAHVISAQAFNCGEQF